MYAHTYSWLTSPVAAVVTPSQVWSALRFASDWSVPWGDASLTRREVWLGNFRQSGAWENCERCDTAGSNNIHGQQVSSTLNMIFRFCSKLETSGFNSINYSARMMLMKGSIQVFLGISIPSISQLVSSSNPLLLLLTLNFVLDNITFPGEVVAFIPSFISLECLSYVYCLFYLHTGYYKIDIRRMGGGVD